VAERIVDPLEPVEVDEDDSEPVTTAPLAGQQVVQGSHYRPVGAPRQVIGSRPVLELAAHAHRLGDVGDARDGACHTALRAVERADVDLARPGRGARLRTKQDLEGAVDVARQDLIDGIAQPGAVIGDRGAQVVHRDRLVLGMDKVHSPTTDELVTPPAEHLDGRLVHLGDNRHLVESGPRHQRGRYRHLPGRRGHRAVIDLGARPLGQHHDHARSMPVAQVESGDMNRALPAEEVGCALGIPLREECLPGGQDGHLVGCRDHVQRCPSGDLPVRAYAYRGRHIAEEGVPAERADYGVWVGRSELSQRMLQLVQAAAATCILAHPGHIGSLEEH
jgi:hypothetical protein